MPIPIKHQAVQQNKAQLNLLNKQLDVFKKAKELKLKKIDFNDRFLNFLNQHPEKIKPIFEYERINGYVDYLKEANAIDIEEKNNNIRLEIMEIQKGIDSLKMQIKVL